MSDPPPSIPRPPLGYSTQPSRGSSPLADYPFHLVVWLIALALLAVPVLLVLPKFEDIFVDFGLKLPLLTRMVLTLGRSLRGGVGWAALVPAAALLALLTAYFPARRPNSGGGRARTVAILAAIALLLLGVVLVVTALFLPMITLVDGLSSQGGK